MVVSDQATMAGEPRRMRLRVQEGVLKFKWLAVATVSVVALAGSVSAAGAFARSNCFIVPSLQHDTSSMISTFTRAILFQRQPEHLACDYYGRGLLYQLQGDDDHAIADFGRAIGWMINYADAYAARADAEDHLGQHDAAAKDYAQAAAISPNLPVQLTERCWVRGLRGYPLALAQQDCTLALSKEPESASALTARGFVELRMANYPAAIADSDAALKLEPRDGSALFIRGVARLKSGDSAGGNADLAAANALTDRITEVYAIYGVKP